MGSTAPQPPSAAYSDAYVTADVMLHNQSKPPNVGNHDKYMTSGSRHPHLDHSLQSAPPHHQTNHGSAVPLSPYPDFAVPYQNHTREHGHGFESSIDGRVDSPQDVKSAFDRRVQGSFSGMSGGRGSSASGKGRPSSLGSAAYGAYHRRNGSVDDTETTSPASSRGYGARQSDETIPLARNIGMEEGMGEDLMNKDDKEKPPPWSELKTKAGKERKRLPLACIACRRKKIRCSGEKPACQHCLRSRIPCVYKVTTRKAAPRTDYMAMLDKRLKRMEERVIKIIPKEEISSMAAIGRANVKPSPPSQHVKINSTKKRQAEEAFGPEVDDWAQSGVNNAGAIISQPPKGLERDENRLLSEGAESLPSKEIQEHLSETFFDYVYGQTYHVLHKPSFMRRLRAGSVPPVLLLAVCAVAARFSTHPQVSTEPAFLRGECWAAPARDIALRRYDEPNITILTVLLILGLHEFGTCQGGRSWMLGGMAMRMAFALQLHRELDHDPLRHKSGKDAELSFTDREIRRRTMWACFLMDRFNSSGTERPTFANEENIKVQLPIKESHFQMDIPGATEHLDGALLNTVSPGGEQASNPQENMGVAAFMIRIIAIWGRVIKYLNLGGKERDPYPMWDINSHFAQLKRQVESFKDSLPSSLQYTSENLKSHAAEKIANQFLFLHISYNQVLLFMYRFVIPSTPGGRLPKEMPKQFVNEAGPTAIEAANQISYLLNESSDHSVVAPFTGYCAFMSSTIHVWGIFSKSPKLEASSKRNLAHNVKYLSKMKKHWGMFHFMAENLKDIYRQHADAALRGPITPGKGTQDAGIFQYGDWFNKYPHGVSGTDYEDPATEIKKESGNDAALSQKSDLQSVEEFFTSLSRPARIENQRKAPKKHGKNSTHQDPQLQPIKPENPPDPAQLHYPPSNHPNLLPLHMSAPHHQPYPLASSPFPPHPPSTSLYPTPPATFPAPYPHPTSTQPLRPPRPLLFDAYSSLNSLQPHPSHSITANLAWDSGGGPLDFASDALFGNAAAAAGAAEAAYAGSAGAGELQSSAWFMPFNLQPPDIGEDGGEGLAGGMGGGGGGGFGGRVGAYRMDGGGEGGGEGGVGAEEGERGVGGGWDGGG